MFGTHHIASSLAVLVCLFPYSAQHVNSAYSDFLFLALNY